VPVVAASLSTLVPNGDGGGSSAQDKAFVGVQRRHIAVSVEVEPSQAMLPVSCYYYSIQCTELVCVAMS